MKHEGLIVAAIGFFLWVLILTPMFGISMNDLTGACLGKSWECGGQEYSKPLHRGKYGDHD
ncbi:MAG: hypothetical protein P8J18_01160 [Halieaceae bacterium]|nr:hypothetical protein [Halieaceae bacterium]